LSTLNGNDTVYVAKLNPGGSQVLFGTTFGGPGNGTERAGGLAVDATGAIYVGGSIGAGGSFATTGTFQQAYAGGGTDVFVAKAPWRLPKCVALFGRQPIPERTPRAVLRRPQSAAGHAHRTCKMHSISNAPSSMTPTSASSL
jgi:hypothetical protein